MTRVLLLSFAVPPATSGSAIIVANLARGFTREELTVAGERPWGKPPVDWDQAWPRIEWVQSQWPVVGRGVRWWRYAQFPFLLGRSLWLAREMEVVLAVFPDEQFLLAGYLVSRLLGKRFFAYLHNTYADNRRGLARRLADWLQPRVFEHAEHVFVMSEGMQELYAQRYPSLKCTPLLHSFSEDLPRPAVHPVGTPMRLVLSGTVNESCQDASARLAEAVSGIPDARLMVYSGVPEGDLREMGVMREGVECATVTRDALLERLRSADLLVLPHGFTGAESPDEYATIFPTRTIEYLISGRPILAHTPPGCFLTRFLLKHDCALVVDRPDVQALRDAIQRLRSDETLRLRLVTNALKTAELFKISRVVGLLRSWLEGRPHTPSDTA